MMKNGSLGIWIPQYVVEKMPQEFQDLLKLSYKDDLELY